jgi:hypothetical protein
MILSNIEDEWNLERFIWKYVDVNDIMFRGKGNLNWYQIEDRGICNESMESFENSYDT